MATKDQCVAEIKKAFPDIKKELVQNLVDHIDSIRQTASDPSEFRSKANQFFREMTRKAEIEVRTSAENAIKLQREIDFVTSGEASVIGMDRSLRSVIVGINEKIKGGNKSIAQEATVIHSKALSMLRDNLEDKRLIKMARDGVADNDVIRIMYNRERGLPDPQNVSPEAVQIADTYSKTYNYLQDQMELAGSSRSRREGYLQRKHSARKIEQAGRDNWKKDMKESMDIESMFPQQYDDPAFIDEFLDDLFERIVMDSYDSPVRIESKDDFLSMFLENKYRGMEKQRTISFKSPEAEIAYREKYVEGNLMDHVVNAAQRDSRASAAMSRLGTNPRAAWEALKSAAARSTAGDRKASDALKSKLSGLDTLYSDTVDGFKTGTSHAAKAGSIARAVASWNTLGSSTLIAFPTDGMTNALMYSATSGESLATSMVKVMSTYTRGMSSKNRREFYKKAQIYIDNSLGEFQSRFNPEDRLTGMMGKGNDLFYNLNMLRQHTEVSKFTGHSLYAQLLGENTTRSFDQLNPTFRNSMERYGIDSSDWEILRNATEDVQGFKNVTPHAIQELRNVSPQKKRDLQMKVSSYLQENAEFRGTPTPDNETRSLLLAGTDANTIPGQLVRFVAHLKSFPLAIGKAISYSLLNRPDMAGMSFKQAFWTPRGMAQMAKVIASLTVMGTMGQIIRDLANNRAVDYSDPEKFRELAMRGFVIGGSAGIYGDFLMAEYNKGYRNFAEDILGPTVGGLGGDLTTITARMARGEPRAIEAFNTLVRNIPGNNLFYTKAALDAMILDEIREYIDPQYMVNKRRRMQREGIEPIIDMR